MLAGNLLASIAGQIQAVAVGWELYQRTDSALSLGLVGLVQFLPVVLLALPAGHVADRYSRKGILVVAQGMMVVNAMALAVLSWVHGPIPLMYLCMALVGVGQAFIMPTRSALVSQVVPPAQLSNAIAWNTSGWQVASMAGPALGGLVIGWSERAAEAYVLAGVCILVGIGLLVTIRPHTPPRQRETLSFASLSAGVRFVFRTKLILATITLDLFAVLLGGATALLPIFARDILEVGPRGLGWLRAAPSIGAFAMALALAHAPLLRRAGLALLVSVAGFGAATIIFGLSTNMALSLGMLAVTGALDNVSMVVRGTLVQLLTPDAMRGRVSAVNTIFIGSSNEFGAFESGLTAHWFGPVWSVVGGGIGTIVVVVATMLAWPEVLRWGALHEVLEEPLPESPSARTPSPRELSL